jgi:hypothetical protein
MPFVRGRLPRGIGWCSAGIAAVLLATGCADQNKSQKPGSAKTSRKTQQNRAVQPVKPSAFAPALAGGGRLILVAALAQGQPAQATPQQPPATPAPQTAPPAGQQPGATTAPTPKMGDADRDALIEMVLAALPAAEHRDVATLGLWLAQIGRAHV